jgi:hypothetical protein
MALIMKNYTVLVHIVGIPPVRVSITAEDEKRAKMDAHRLYIYDDVYRIEVI